MSIRKYRVKYWDGGGDVQTKVVEAFDAADAIVQVELGFRLILDGVKRYANSVAPESDAPETWMVTRACPEHKSLGTDYAFKPFHWPVGAQPCKQCLYEKVIEHRTVEGMTIRIDPCPKGGEHQFVSAKQEDGSIRIHCVRCSP